MPATSIRYFGFMDTSGRARSHIDRRSGLLQNVILRMRCRLMPSAPAVQGQEFGIVHSGMLHRHCTYVEYCSHVVSAGPSTVRTERNEIRPRGHAAKLMPIAKNYSRAYFVGR